MTNPTAQAITRRELFDPIRHLFARRDRDTPQRGLALLDVLLGMAILALIVVIGAQNFSMRRERAYLTAALSDAEQAAVGLEAIATDGSAYPASVGSNGAEIAGFNMTGGNEVRGYEVTANGNSFKVCVAHWKNDAYGAYAVYDSEGGSIVGSGNDGSCTEDDGSVTTPVDGDENADRFTFTSASYDAATHKVTVIGTDFNAADVDQISFRGTTASSYTIVNATTLIFDVPAVYPNPLNSGPGGSVAQDHPIYIVHGNGMTDGGYTASGSVHVPAASVDADADSDGDGFTDAEEMTSGGNPNDPNSPFPGGKNGDMDGDGVSNWDELRLYGPSAVNDPNIPGSATPPPSAGAPEVTAVTPGADRSVRLTGTNLGSVTGAYLVCGGGCQFPLSNMTGQSATSITFTVPPGPPAGFSAPLVLRYGSRQTVNAGNVTTP